MQQIEGIVTEVLDEISITNQNGTIIKQSFVLGTSDNPKFPKKILITGWGENSKIVNKLKTGSKVIASVSIESREYNSKWYTELKAIKIQEVSEGNKIEDLGEFSRLFS